MRGFRQRRKAAPAQAGASDRAPGPSRRRRLWKISSFLFAVHVVGALSSLHALMSVRTSQGTVAWVVSLNTYPVVAVPAYWVLGRNKFNGYILERQTTDADLHDDVKRLAPQLAPFLLDAGIAVYRYEHGFLHQKAFLVDDVAAGIGTVNLDNRSFRLNFEVTALIASAPFAAEVEQMFEEDFAHARRMTRAEITARSWPQQVLSRASYLFAPLL